MYRSMYTDDGFRRRDDMDTYVGDGSESFARTAKSSDDIRYIPGMTVGLEYVLRELGIDTVSQMLAKLLSYVDGVNEPMEVLNAYYLWFKEISKGTIASETNFHTCVRAMGQYAVECGLLEDYE